MSAYEVPPGWYALGTHADQDVRLEFSTYAVDDTGLPLWERPVMVECGTCDGGGEIGGFIDCPICDGTGEAPAPALPGERADGEDRT